MADPDKPEFPWLNVRLIQLFCDGLFDSSSFSQIERACSARSAAHSAYNFISEPSSRQNRRHAEGARISRMC